MRHHATIEFKKCLRINTVGALLKTDIRKYQIHGLDYHSIGDGHLLGGGGSVLKDLQLGLGVVLQVLAVSEDLTRLDQGHWLLQALLLPCLSVL